MFNFKEINVILMLFIVGFIYAQQEYTFSTEDRTTVLEVNEFNDGYAGLYRVDSMQYHYWGGLILFDDSFNYEITEWKSDTADIYFRDFVVTDENNLLLVGTISNIESEYSSTLYIRLLDESLNVLNENFFEMPYEVYHPKMKMFRTQQGRNYVYMNDGTFVPSFHAFIELSDQGEVVKNKFYEGAGWQINAFANPHSDTSFYIYQDAVANYACEIVEVDTNLNYTKTPIYDFFNGEWYDFGSRGSCKWNSDTTYILETYGMSDDNDRELILYKMGMDHQFIGEPVLIGQTNYPDNALVQRAMDWKEPSKIYVASWYWPSMGMALPYYIAVINQDFELLGAKSMGNENKNLLVYSLIATEEGGCILVGAQRDITLGDENAWDGYVAFFSENDLITAAPETPNPYDSDYLLFPNPGKELSVQTTRKEVIIEIYNQAGIRVLNTKLTDDFQSKVNTSKLKRGVYVCQFIDKYGFREIKKWIKL